MTGLGVYGIAAGGQGQGVRGDSGSGIGVLGITSATSGQGRGVWGESAAPDGIGVFGRNTALNGQNAGSVGVWGETSGQFGYGVYGLATSTSLTAQNKGVIGSATGNNNLSTGVYGIGGAYGVFGLGPNGVFPKAT